MISLHLEDYKSLFIGSAFFSCGGGVPYANSIALMNQSAQNPKTKLMSLVDFSPTDWLCTVYAIGASGHGEKKYSSFLLAIQQLEDHLGIQIAGVIPGEIGSEINAVWVANNNNLAIVDTDMVGGRAVPEEQMDLYGLKGIPSTPVVIVNDKSDVIIVKEAHDMVVMEKVYRSFAIAFGGYCYIASRPLQQKNAQTFLPSGTVTKSILVGREMLSCKTENQIIKVFQKNCNSRLLAKGKVMANSLKDEPGFLSGIIHLEGCGVFSSKKFTIHYKNENIIIFQDNEYLCSVPDLISIVDSESLMPVSNNSLQVGNTVLIFGTPSLPVWRTKQGIDLLGPKQFGFNQNYKPL